MISNYPYIIGITGHRDLVQEDIPALREQIAACFDAAKSSCGNVQVCVVTSLAEGADQLCAELALEKGFGLITVLPMDADELEKDFEGEALQNFRRLLEASDEVFVTPDVENGKVAAEVAGSKSSDPAGRSYWHRQAGLYLTQRCQLILALWDGKPDATGCGTAAVFDYASNDWSHDGHGFAYNPEMIVIPVRRAKNPDSEAGNPDDNIIGRLSENVAEYAGHVGELAAEEKKYLESGNTKDPVNDLAVHYRDKYKKATLWIAICNVATVLLFMLYDALNIKAALIFTLMTLAASLIIKAKVGEKNGNYLNKYIEFRALAETNRVQEFVSGMGKFYSVCDFFTCFQKSSLKWVEQAARVRLVGTFGDKYPDGDAIRRDWCFGQHVYHQNAARRDAPKLERQRKFSKAAAIVSGLNYVALAVVEYSGIVGTESGNTTVQVLKIVSAFFTAIAVFASDYYAKQKLDRKVEDSEKMAELYEKADAEWLRLDEEGLPKDELVAMLARAEIEENGNWVAYQRK